MAACNLRFGEKSLRDVWPIKTGAVNLLLMAVFIACGPQKETQEGRVVARMDRLVVTAGEFREFYELDPLLGEWEEPGVNALGASLTRLMVRKIIFQDSLAKGAFRSGPLKPIFTWEIRQAMLRQLFREEIQDRVQVEEEELRKEYIKWNEELFVRHLFFPSYQEALQARQRLERGDVTFEQLAREVFRDSRLVNTGGALGWVRAGDLYRSLEDRLFELPPGKISRPVKSPWGYHLLRVDSIKANPILREDDFQFRREVLEKRVRLRKIRAMASRYIQDLLRPLVIRLKHQTFNLLWHALREEPESPGVLHPLRSPYLTNNRLERLKSLLADELNRPLIQYRDGVFTLGEFLEDLENIPVGNRCRLGTRFQMINDLGIWVRDQFLLQEAHRKNLMGHPRVRREVAEVLGHYLYQQRLYQIMDTLSIPPAVRGYFEERGAGKFAAAADSLEPFNSLLEWQYHRAQQILHHRVLRSLRRMEVDSAFLREEAPRVHWRSPVKFFVFRLPS